MKTTDCILYGSVVLIGAGLTFLAGPATAAVIVGIIGVFIAMIKSVNY